MSLSTVFRRVFSKISYTKVMMSNPIVEVDGGKLQGCVFKTTKSVQFYSFKGIPYAKPPIGDLRFCIPQPPEPWEGIRDAAKDCNICAQFDNDSKTIVGNEDCLYLNVYTPTLPLTGSSKLPVMVFIHGGGFLFGNGTDPSKHGPDFLISKDVIIVSFNYRLGILGFLSLDRKEAPGNMGLRDQVQALKWVQRNIDKFSGDPDNVTIFGISAGGASVEYLMLSPMAKGLFHKAIAQSGSSLVQWAQNDWRKIKELASKIPEMNEQIISNDEELLDYLKSMPISDLVISSLKVKATADFRGSINFSFVPVVEKSGDWEPFLNKPTYEILANGEFTKVPYITGFCEREGLLAITHGTAVLNKLVQEKLFVDHFPFDLEPTEKIEIENRLKDIYLQGKTKSKDTDAFAIDYFTDVDFLGGIYVAAKMVAKHSPVYFYEFSYDGALNYVKLHLNINREGAAHADDGGYLLKSDKLNGPLSDTDVYVQNTLLELWTNFAKYGNPTPETSEVTTKWELFSETTPCRLVIDKNTSMKYEVYPERTKLYEELYEKKFGSNKM